MDAFVCVCIQLSCCNYGVIKHDDGGDDNISSFYV